MTQICVELSDTVIMRVALLLAHFASRCTTQSKQSERLKLMPGLAVLYVVRHAEGSDLYLQSRGPLSQSKAVRKIHKHNHNCGLYIILRRRGGATGRALDL